jgi:hypothetical protein
MRKASCAVLLGTVSVLLALGCGEPSSPVETALSGQPDRTGLLLSKTDGAPPTGLVDVADVGRFWPFTGTDFSGNPQDPINLIVIGQADPRALRAALIFQGWTDAIGGVQTGYGLPEGWVENPIQMQLGDYAPVRFHVRFFDVGDFTLGGSHFEVLIPGTTDHQVLSWELAEGKVALDLSASGLLDPTAPFFPSGPINPSPYGEIPAVIYNGLADDIIALIGGPPKPVSAPVPQANDGSATVLNFAASVDGGHIVATQEFVIDFNQVIPKPFCASGPLDFLLVQGPVKLRQRVVFTPSGNFISQFHANGHLELTPVNPATTPPTPIGKTYRSQVNEHHKGVLTDNVSLASSFQMFIEIPPKGPFRGQLLVKLKVGPGESSQFSMKIKCTEPPGA